MAFPVGWVKVLVDDPAWPALQRDPGTLDLVTRVLFSATLMAYPFLPEWERLGREDVDTLRREFLLALGALYPDKFEVRPEGGSASARWRDYRRFNPHRGDGGRWGGRLGR
jgi:hypothetical protein